MKEFLCWETVGMGLVELYIERMGNPERGTDACRGNFLNGETLTIFLYGIWGGGLTTVLG